ncbi:sensor domain-containing diguanylate cyclase [Paenibacillus sp. R14(2021)]|uniref:sensor domain-containing diguanylate cyclase n=1 Tax=Paenibacillus sp. R14(2021) TaxID=2859228 RepID=UPI001C61445B|nr:sensor domain-containing diguanylate cyclase [Paenibacillus sp. R14(2021)]
MLRSQGYSIRFMVSAIVVAAVLITLCVSSIIGYRNEKASLIAMTFQLNGMYTDKIADTVNELFTGMKSNLEVYAEDLGKNGLERTNLDSQVAIIQRTNPLFKSIVLVDKHGKVLSIEPANKQLMGVTLVSKGAKEALREQRPLISDPYIGATNQLILMVSQPIRNVKGEYLGYIGGTIRLHEPNLLNTMLGDERQEDGSYAYVVSATGTLIYHPEQDRIGEQILQNSVVRELVAGRSGSRRVINSKGVDMLASYTYIKETGWGIVSQTPTAVVLKASKKPIFHAISYVLPIMLVILLAIYWVIGKMSEPLTKLAQFAALLTSNKPLRDEVPRINSWNREANALHRAFHVAAAHLRNQLEHLSQEAQTDALTGLYNRRTMDLYMKTWIGQGLPFALLVLDLDKFKQVNDTYGHEMGDKVLKFLAANMRTHLEKSHICCRFGGEEFVALMPEADLDTAQRYAETLRAVMAETDSPVGRPVTLSIGVARFPESAHGPEALFRIADEALYRAKHLGRNRVEMVAEVHALRTMNEA